MKNIKYKQPKWNEWTILVGGIKFKALQDAGAISKEGEIVSIQKWIQVENELKNK